MNIRSKATLVVGAVMVPFALFNVVDDAWLPGAGHPILEAVVGLLAVSVILFSLDRMIFARIDLLASEVSRTGAGGELDERLEVPGTDEISGIAESLNGTIAALSVTADELGESEDRFLAITESARDAVFIVDARGAVAYWNGAAASIFGYSSEQAVSAPLGTLVIPTEAASDYLDGLARARSEGGVTFESSARDADGSRFPVEISASAVEFDDEPALVCIARDISERTNMRVIEHMATHDTLTDLPNRNLLTDRLTQAVAMAKRSQGVVAVLFIDLDHFKQVNDMMGHSTGDRLLREVAIRLKSTVRESDTVARIGGDEFAVVGTNLVRPEEAAKMADSILAALGHHIEMDGHEFLITPSIGISLFPSPDAGDEATPDSLLGQADLAMYAAKKKGRNNYEFFDREMKEETHRRIAMASDLRAAISSDQLLLHFQPQVRLPDGAIVGAEALLRWSHPTRGMIPPLEFIPIAEETGDIIAIGEWVLMQSLRACAAWDEAGLPAIRVAVNLAPLQLSKGSIVDSVARALTRTGLSSSRLQLEMTETVLMEHVDGVISKLDALCLSGVHLSLDDFGTGHSSLSRLRRLPIEEVKIDRSFVMGMGSNEESEEIVKLIIGLGRILRRTVVAEGAETAEEVIKLMEYGCDLIQGYYFSRPLPQDEFIAWVTANKGKAQLPQR